MEIDKIVYDVEVAISPKDVEGEWDNPAGMGFASAVTYSYKDDLYKFWLGPDDLVPLVKYLTGKTAITFNGIRFDSRVLLGNDRGLSDDGRTFSLKEEKEIWFDNFDLLQEYVKNRFEMKTAKEAENALKYIKHDGTFSLGSISKATLNLDKIGSGANAPLLYQAKKYTDLLSYNLQDVRLTRKLYDFVMENRFLADSAGRVVEL